MAGATIQHPPQCSPRHHRRPADGRSAPAPAPRARPRHALRRRPKAPARASSSKSAPWAGRPRYRLHADDTAGNSVSWTDLRFSNSVTTRSSLLSPVGAIGHVARARTIDPADWSVDDAYPHYDQVGSVVAATGADGLASTRREADAWGNDLASWSTGLWAAPAGGWGHNTKAFDPAADLVYMYQRWYDPKTGTFASSAPYPPMIEHRYGFAENNPVQAVDPDGRRIILYGPQRDRRRMAMAIYALSQDPVGEILVDQLRNSSNDHYFHISNTLPDGTPCPPGMLGGIGAINPQNESNGVGTGSVTFLNPTPGGTTKLPEIIIHEAVHAYDMDRGEIVREMDLPYLQRTTEKRAFLISDGYRRRQ